MELQQLKEIATKLNYQHHHNIGANKLEEQLRDYCKNELNITLEEVMKDMVFEPTKDEYAPTSPETVEEAKKEIKEETIKPRIVNDEVDTNLVEKLSKLTFSRVESENNKKTSAERTRDAMKLIRCVITCNNKNKTSYQGEIFSVRNAVIPEVKKYVPFGVTTHVPQILLNMIKEKQYQQFKTEKTVNGTPHKTSMMIPEYNIQILNPITAEELESIKQKQLAEGFGK